MTVNSLLNYMESVLGKMHLLLRIMEQDQNVDFHFDFGLRRISGRDESYRALIELSRDKVEERTIYKLTDEYYCNYIFLKLGEKYGSKALLIGPYVKLPMNTAVVTDLAQKLSVPPQRIKALEDAYSNIPFLVDDSFLYAMINSLGEILWGGGKYYIFTDINLEELELFKSVFSNEEEQEQEDALISMHLMEKRYEWEGDLMLLVSRGQSNRARKMLPDIGSLSFKQRLADPIRNMKNYCIICNTLMRKAAQQGGVHPIYLDRASSEYASKIEAQTDMEQVTSLIGDMINDYCRLVRKYSMKDYSQHVRHAILLVDSQLTNELSLRHIASALELNPSYLSGIFKKETGQTITDFISHRRVEQASKLLRTTSMQIQDVAMYCGIPDANYFSKVFKKYTGKSPAEYRSLPQAMR